MTTEPRETLLRLTKIWSFEIEALGHLFPLSEGNDRICYHLHEDPLDERDHRNADEVYAALCEAGVKIERDALADYPWEKWEKRWPTTDWVEHDLPKIFDTLNRFRHGIYAITYEPCKRMRGLYEAAFRDAWDHANPRTRPPGCEAEDLSGKTARVVFHVRLHEAIYRAIKGGRLTLQEAAERLGAITDDIRARWADKDAEARWLIDFPRLGEFPHFSEQHEELVRWAVWSVVNDEAEKAN